MMILDHILKLSDADVKKMQQAVPKDKKIHQMMAEIKADSEKSDESDDQKDGTCPSFLFGLV